MQNRRHTFFYLLFCLAALITMNSCKKDKNTITRLPNIAITPLTVTEKNIGDTTTIIPTVTYDGKDASFTYKWYKYILNNKIKLVSTSKNLFLTLDSLGTWAMKVEVTNTVTGVAQNSYFSFTVVSRSERGWYMLKADASGNTEMDAFLTTSKGLETTNNIFASRYGKAMTGAPVALAFTSNYTWFNPATAAFVSSNICLIPVSQKEILSYRIKDEKVLVATKDLFYEEIIESNRDFQGLAGDPNLMTIVNGGRVLGMAPSTNSFLSERAGDYSLSPYMTLAPYKSGSLSYILGFNQTNESFLTIRYRQTDITYFPDVYLTGIPAISSNKVGGKLLFMENTDGTFDPGYGVDNGATMVNAKAYALLKKDNSTDLFLMGLNLTEIQPLVTTALPRNGTHSIVAEKTDLSSATYPELATATLYTLNKNTPILYFTKGNVIGSYNITTKEYINNLFSFPAGEEISYIKFIDAQYEAVAANNFKNLVVATYLNGNYKVYRFTVSENTLTQSSSVFQGIGRIKTLMYVTPNNGFPLNINNSQYRYY